MVIVLVYLQGLEVWFLMEQKRLLGGVRLTPALLPKKEKDHSRFPCKVSSMIHIYMPRPDPLPCVALQVGVYHRKSIVLVTDPYMYITS
jgi:hypothetical protein